MSEEIPESVWQGSFMIGGVELKCHVLSNGQRIIEAESLEQLFGAPAGSLSPDDEGLKEFGKWQRGGKN